MTSVWLQSEYVEVECGADGCSQRFAMTRRFYDKTRETGQTWYCPAGHPRAWRGKTTRQKLDAEQARTRHLEDQLRASIVDAERVRSLLLRDRHRFANGVCPCCNRSFTNVRRHMETQHPDYEVSELPGQVAFSCSCGYAAETWRGLRVHQGHMRGEGWSDPGASRWSSHLTVVGS